MFTQLINNLCIIIISLSHSLSHSIYLITFHNLKLYLPSITLLRTPSHSPSLTPSLLHPPRLILTPFASVHQERLQRKVAESLQVASVLRCMRRGECDISKNPKHIEINLLVLRFWYVGFIII